MDTPGRPGNAKSQGKKFDWTKIIAVTLGVGVVVVAVTMEIRHRKTASIYQESLKNAVEKIEDLDKRVTQKAEQLENLNKRFNKKKEELDLTNKTLQEQKKQLEEKDAEIRRLDLLSREANLLLCNTSLSDITAFVAYEVDATSSRIDEPYKIAVGDCVEIQRHISNGAEKGFLVYGYQDATPEFRHVNNSINQYMRSEPGYVALEYDEGMIHHHMTEDQLICLDLYQDKARTISTMKDDTSCTSGTMMVGFSKAGLDPSFTKTKRRWVHVFEQPNLPLFHRVPGEPFKYLGEGLQRAKSLAAAANRQIEAADYFKGETIITQFPARMDDVNTSLWPGVLIDDVAETDIFGNHQQIANGDFVTAINGRPVYSMIEILQIIDQHAKDIDNGGIQIPLVVTVKRDGCPEAGCVVEASYFWNPIGLANSDVGMSTASYYSLLDGAFFDQGPAVNCAGDEFITFAGNLATSAFIMVVDLLRDDKEFELQYVPGFRTEYSTFNKCKWHEEQRKAIAIQKYAVTYRDVGFLSFVFPGSIRIVITKGLRKKAARKLGKTQFARGIGDGIAEAIETGLSVLPNNGIGTPLIDRVKDAVKIMPIAGGLGFSTGLIDGPRRKPGKKRKKLSLDEWASGGIW